MRQNDERLAAMRPIARQIPCVHAFGRSNDVVFGRGGVQVRMRRLVCGVVPSNCAPFTFDCVLEPHVLGSMG